MGRCIVVLGLPRSGTSAIAGALHHMGVDMGIGHLQAGNHSNPKGYYEDLRWQAINKRVTGPRYGTGRYMTEDIRRAYASLARKCDTKALWGMKDPRLCFTAPYIDHHLESPRYLVINRNHDGVIRSLVHHSETNYGGQYRMTKKQAMGTLGVWNEALEETLRDAAIRRTVRLSYDDLINRPTTMLWQIVMSFLFEDLFLDLDVQAGVDFIDRGLKHF